MTIPRILKTSIFPFWLSLAAYTSFAALILLMSSSFNSGIDAILEYTFAEPATLFNYIMTPVLWWAFRELRAQYEPIEKSPNHLISTLFAASLFVCLGAWGLAHFYPHEQKYLYVEAVEGLSQNIRNGSMIYSMLIGIVGLLVTVTHMPTLIVPIFIACRSGYALYNVYIHQHIKALLFKS